jgi:ectoine hydroxylase-related dioxygenase (phytanoyl-CoA dioxygenase family)
MITVDCRNDADWLAVTLEAVRVAGYAVVEGVLPGEFLADGAAALSQAQTRILQDVGAERLAAAGERGVLRLMMAYEPHFFRYLELPQVLAVIDATVSPTAILHLQNGFILPPATEAPEEGVFQTQFHMDFPRVLNGYLMSINLLFTIDAFNERNGGTLVVPGSHQMPVQPDKEYLGRAAVSVECGAGSMIVFDSTVWHAAGRNRSERERRGINHQFTRSYVKQQIDYVRALGDDVIESLPARTQQLLGWYTRVVTSLDEYYQPAERRLYRAGQG